MYDTWRKLRREANEKTYTADDRERGIGSSVIHVTRTVKLIERPHDSDDEINPEINSNDSAEISD